MRVEQAVFGELDRGHGLLAATGDRRLAAELAPRFDLPDTAPPGVSWSPYPSGFAHQDRYVVARTFHDAQASRPGMVLTHALIAQLDEVARLDDLGALMATLPTEARRPSSLTSLDLDARPGPAVDAPELVGLAEALLTGGDGPVVRLGVDGFERLVVALWRQLWPSVRRDLSFRLSFGPDDVRDTPRPTFVCSPASLTTRWRGARVMDPTPRMPGSAAAAALAGIARTPSPLAFARSIGACLATFVELRLAEQALGLDEAAGVSFGDAVAVVRLVQRLSPAPDRGAEAKARLLDRLSSRVSEAGGRAALALRNLELGGFRASSVVWDHLGRAVASDGYAPGTDATTTSMVEAALGRSAAVAPWRDAVRRGLREAARRRDDGGFRDAIWRLIDAEPGLAEGLAEAVDLDPTVERDLVDGAPRAIGGEAAGALASIARVRGLRDLHGVAVSAIGSASEAARAQIAMEGTSPGGRGLALALRNATADEVLACALTLDDPRLVEMAGRALVGRPGSLAVADAGTARGQAIWAAALSSDAGAWTAPVDPEAAIRTVLGNLVVGGVADRGLLSALGSTPLADLQHFERRSEIWDGLRASAGTSYLDATAAGWKMRALEGGTVPTPDRTLEDAILRRSPFGPGGSVDLAGGLRMAFALPGLVEHDVSAWVERSVAGTRDIARVDAEALGRLVLARSWRRILDSLKRSFRAGRGDLRPALVVAAPLLGWFESWVLHLSTPSPDDKWEALRELVTDLYRLGPAENDLWQRAGGSDADLPITGSGRDLWRDALARMRRGGGRVRVDRLLREVAVDFPQNEQVRLLTSDPDFGGERWRR